MTSGNEPSPRRVLFFLCAVTASATTRALTHENRVEPQVLIQQRTRLFMPDGSEWSCTLDVRTDPEPATVGLSNCQAKEKP